MGSYKFRWAHPAGEVFVTGTFDDWSKSVRLEHANGGFEKLVNLPTTGRKIYYKFVVDGHWTTDYSLPCENDGSNNVNNFLTPEDIKPAQQASTHHDDMPGAFPETPAFEKQSYGVSPLPAIPSFGNPVSLAAGQAVPHHSNYTADSIGSNVKLDQESYERSDAYPGAGGSDAFSQSRGAFGVPPVSGTMIPESSLPMGYDGSVERDAGPTIQSAGAGTSTASLAGQVPLEPRGVPRVVAESQEAANVDPEASASSEAVSDKKQMEQEFMSVIPEQRAVTSDDRGSTGASTTQAASAVPQVVAASLHKAHESPEAAGNPEVVSEKQDMEKELKSRVPLEPVTSQGDRDLSGAVSEPAEPASNVPQIVADSQYEADEPVEAAGNAEAVSEKQAMEEELKSRVPLEPVTSEGDRFVASASATEPASNVPQIVADSQHEADGPVEAAGNAEAVSEKQAMEEELKSRVPLEPVTSEGDRFVAGASATEPASNVPQIVADSQYEADAPFEAAGNPEAVSEKQAVEQELKSKVPEEQPISESRSVGQSAGASTGESTGASIAGIQVGKYAAAASSWMPASIQQAITDMNHGKSPLPALTGSGTADEDTTTSTDRGISNTTATESTPAAYEKPTTTADDVPSVVTDSLDRAHQSPEAAAYPEAVAEKSAFERELLRDVPPAEGTGEPAPTEASALSESAPAPTQEHSTLLDEDTAPAISAMTIGGRDTAVLVAPHAEDRVGTVAAQDYSREVEDIPAAATYGDESTNYSQASQAEADVVPTSTTFGHSSFGSAPEKSQSSEIAADSAGNTWAKETTQSQYSSEAPRSVVDRVFGAPVVNDVSSTSAATTSYQTTSASAVPSSYESTSAAPTSYETAAPVETSPRTNLTEQGPIDPFKDDPISAYSGSVPATTSSTSNLDPRTTASTFASDPISASEPATTQSAAAATTTPSKAQTSTPSALLSTPVSTPTKQTSTSPALAAASSAAAAASKRNSVLPGSSMAAAVKQSAGGESRDVSPMSRNQGLGVAAGAGAAKVGGGAEARATGWHGAGTSGSAVAGSSGKASGSPSGKAVGGSPSGSPGAAGGKDVKEEKRRKRQSFFGKLKDKLSGHK